MVSMKVIIITVAVVAGLIGIVLAKMKVVKEVVYERNDRFESFDAFAAGHGFRIMSDDQKSVFRKTIYKYTRTGFIADIFRSLKPTDRYAEKKRNNISEFLLHHFAVHQSGGNFTHVYGVLIESDRFNLPEVLITPSGYFSNLMKVVRKGDQWESHEVIPGYDCFTRNDRVDPGSVPAFAAVLNAQQEPLFSIHALEKGFLVFFIQRNKDVEDDFDYAHLYESARKMMEAIR